MTDLIEYNPFPEDWGWAPFSAQGHGAQRENDC